MISFEGGGHYAFRQYFNSVNTEIHQLLVKVTANLETIDFPSTREFNESETDFAKEDKAKAEKQVIYKTNV